MGSPSASLSWDVGEGAHDDGTGVVKVDTSRYFDVHHTHADTLDKVDPEALAKGTAAVAWTAYAFAEMPGLLARPTAPPKAPSLTGAPAVPTPAPTAPSTPAAGGTKPSAH